MAFVCARLDDGLNHRAGAPVESATMGGAVRRSINNEACLGAGARAILQIQETSVMLAVSPLDLFRPPGRQVLPPGGVSPCRGGTPPHVSGSRVDQW